MLVKKGTSGYLGSSSSIYLNWNISVFYCHIDIKLTLLKQNDDDFCFVIVTFLCHFRSHRHDVIHIQLRIYLLIVVGLSHNVVRVVWVVHDTLRSYKILCDIKGHFDLLGQLHGK